MTTHEAMKVIAKRIFSMGETPMGRGGLVPTWYADAKPSEYNFASDILFETYEATHFGLHWSGDKKTVKISLSKADAFGAVIKTEFILTEELPVSELV